MTPVDQHDVNWAHEVCTASRYVHINVWRFSPDHVIAQTIISLLERARNELLSIRNSGDFDKDKHKVDSYIKNITSRVKNLKENYLKGNPSDFVPQDKLSQT
jgi:hypothetical protein